MEDFLDGDDDYGDLYADVEVQATSAITSAASFAKPFSAPEQQIIKQDDKGSKSNADNVVPSSEGGNFSTGSNPANNSVCCEVSRKVEAEEGSESDDDGLNIVLNDEDSDGVPISHTLARSCDGGYEEADEGPVGSALDKGGDGSWQGNGVQRSYSLQHRQCKEKRLYPSAFAKENESSSVPSHSPKSMRSDSDNNRFMQHNAANTNLVSNGYAMANSVVYHGGCGYSLPWHRTIFDVNIDSFEEKRWRYPGANMSSFFNFGFDEDSWRQYSNSVPKGRAIEVEDSGTERLPTMDQSCPENWESDVVIQIKVQEFEENSAASGKVDLSDKSNGEKASRSCELSTDDVGEASHSIGPNGGQMSMGSAEGNTRSSHSMLEANKLAPHHEKSERDQVSDSGEHHPRRDRAKTAEVTESVGCERDSNNGFERNMSKSYHDNCETEQIDEHHPRRNQAKTAEVTEPVGRERDSKNEFERNVSKTDQHRSNSVSLLDEKSHLSLTLSCSESETEPSGESCHGIYRRSSLGTELRDSGTSCHNSCKSNGKKQADSGQRCMTGNSLSEGRRWSGEERYRRVSEHQKYQDEHDDQSTKGRLIGGSRQIKHLHDLDLPKRKDSSYFRARDFPLGDGSQRRAGRYVEADNGRHTQNTRHQSSRHESDMWDRENHNHSASLQNKGLRYQHSIDVDRHYGGEEISPYVTVSPTLPRKHSSVRERQVQLRRKSEKLQLGKSHDDLVFDSAMDFPRHRYDSMNEKYESHSPILGREINTRERVLRNHSDAMHVDHPWYEEEEEEEEMLRDHWNDYQREWNYDQDPHLKSHTRSYTYNQGRWNDSKIPTRYGKYEPRVMENENHSRLREGIYDDPGTYDDGFAGNYVHGTNSKDEYMDFDDEHHFTKRRYVWRSRFHQAEEPISTTGGDWSYFDRTSSCYRKTLRQDNTNASYRYEDSGMTTGDKLSEEHGYETIREEYRDNLVNRSLMYRCEREKMVRTCVNYPAELGFGEVKFNAVTDQALASPPSGIHTTHGSLPSFGKSRKQCMKQDKPKFQKLSIATLSGKANRRLNVETNSSQDAKEQFGKSPPATEHKNESDIEEGQIITDEPMIQVYRQDNKGHPATTFPRSNANKEKALQNADAASNKVYDEQWLQDRLAKMEKRRERFKEATAAAPSEKVTDQIPSSQLQADTLVNTVETKQERPARKRRWAGS